MAQKIVVTALKLADAPSQNRIWAKVLPGDNVYIAGGVQLNLSPGAILDPSGLGVTGPSSVPAVTPGVFSQNIGGYVASVVPATGKGTAGLATYKLQYFQPSGPELGAGAYPNAITAGQVILEILS